MSSTSQEIVNRRLEEKVCIITGGASGIGKEAAHLFASHGAHVIIVDLQDELGQAVAATLPPPGRHHYIHCDVTQEADVAAAVDMAVATFGRLDVMFNNAGIHDNQARPLQHLDTEMWDRVMAINLRGVVLGMKHAARVMVPTQRGVIINTVSVAATSSIEGINISYTTSKHAVLGLTKAGAVELGKVGIRVNSVAPFFVLTPMVMKLAEHANLSKEDMEARGRSAEVLKREPFCQAIDIAQAALFLASDEASYVNGHNLVVDGGYTIAGRTFQSSKT